MAERNPPNGDSPKRDLAFREFMGMNTRNARNAIPDKQFPLLLNFQPIGDGNLSAVAGPTEIAQVSNFFRMDVFKGTYTNDQIVQFRNDYGLNLIDTVTGQVTPISDQIWLGTPRSTTWQNLTLLIASQDGVFYIDVDNNLVHVNDTHPEAPINCTDIAVYAGRVWVTDGRTVYFSAPNSYTDWTSANGAGSFIMTDSAVRSVITRLFSANGYLYLFTANSINVVSNVQVPAGASPPTPVFTNVNIDAIIGTNQPDSVTLYSRTVCFANQFGFFGLDGVTVRRLSADIDGTIQQVDFNYPVTAASAVVNNILCICFSFQWMNPELTSGNQAAMACYFDGKWFLSAQDRSAASPSAMSYRNVRQVVSGFYNGKPTAFMASYIGSATSGPVKMLRAFGDASVQLSRQINTALWNMGNPLRVKQSLKIGLDAFFPSSSSLPVQMCIVNELSDEYCSSFGGSAGSETQWINNFGTILPWTNNGGATIKWSGSSASGGGGIPSYSDIIIQYKDAKLYGGHYLGLKLTTQRPQITINSFYIQYENRGEWQDITPFSVTPVTPIPPPPPATTKGAPIIYFSNVSGRSYSLAYPANTDQPKTLFMDALEQQPTGYTVSGSQLLLSTSFDPANYENLTLLYYTGNSTSTGLPVKYENTVSGRTYSLPSVVRAGAPAMLFLDGELQKPSDFTAVNGTLTIGGGIDISNYQTLILWYYNTAGANPGSPRVYSTFVSGGTYALPYAANTQKTLLFLDGRAMSSSVYTVSGSSLSIPVDLSFYQNLSILYFST